MRLGKKIAEALLKQTRKLSKDLNKYLPIESQNSLISRVDVKQVGQV